MWQQGYEIFLSVFCCLSEGNISQLRIKDQDLRVCISPTRQATSALIQIEPSAVEDAFRPGYCIFQCSTGVENTFLRRYCIFYMCLSISGQVPFTTVY